MKRFFCVQPYGVKRHKLMPSGAITFEILEDAVAAGRRLARIRTGVVVLSQDIDARSGTLSKPMVIAIHGKVPAPWAEIARAEIIQVKTAA